MSEEISIEVISGKFYSNAKKLYTQLFKEVLNKQREIMLENNVAEEIINKVTAINLNHKQKKDRNPNTACKAKCKSSNTFCSSLRKEGSNYCGRHKNYATDNSSNGGETVENENDNNNNNNNDIDINNENGNYDGNNNDNEADNEDTNSTDENSTNYTAKADDEPYVMTKNGKRYLIMGEKVYECPENYRKNTQYDEDDLTLLGLIKDGVIKLNKSKN